MLTLGPARAIPMLRKVLTMFQNDMGSLTLLVACLAVLGEYREAERYLARLADNDPTGLWAHFSGLELAALRGDYTAGSDELHTALDDPRTNDYMRGISNFILGDVEAGLVAWRRGQQTNGPNDVVLRWAVHNETCFPSSVVNHPGYQDILDSGGTGRRWTAYLREKVAELAPITGIAPGDPAPQKVFLSR
jgi:tetratricopeptide (TPR) repeat protein